MLTTMVESMLHSRFFMVAGLARSEAM